MLQYRTESDRNKKGVCFRYAKHGSGSDGCSKGESCLYSHDPILCKEFLKQTVNEQYTKRNKLMILSQCMGSPQLLDAAKELGDEFKVFCSLLQETE